MNPNAEIAPGALDAKDLKSLGSATTYKYDAPSADILEVFPNPAPQAEHLPGKGYEVVHETSEFTSLCPKTGQPDFATITITVIPDKVCVESKSLKLYLGAYRNTGAFMERITNQIRDDLVKVLDPLDLEVEAEFGARGGITTSVRAIYNRQQEARAEMMRRFLNGDEGGPVG